MISFIHQCLVLREREGPSHGVECSLGVEVEFFEVLLDDHSGLCGVPDPAVAHDLYLEVDRSLRSHGKTLKGCRHFVAQGD